jgi:hypothetical protein
MPIRIGWAFQYALIAAFLVPASPCRAEGESAPGVQERVKAAFLHKFAGYVEWPREAFPDAASPVTIGVAGASAIATELEEAVTGRRIGERPLHVRRLLRGDRRCDGCQMLFIGRDVEPARAAQLLESAKGRPVLTVTESEGEQPPGSVIHFVGTADRIRFDIAREAEDENGLRLASPLLAIARQVKANEP